MTTSLLILTPEIPAAAVSWTKTNEKDFHPALNTFRGERWQEWQSSTNLADHILRYRLATGTTKSANFLCVPRVDRIRLNVAAAATTLTLESSPDDSAWTTVDTVSNVQSFAGSIYGRLGKDYVNTFAASTARQYWRIKISSSTTFQMKLAKAYFGTAFDFGKDPESYIAPREIEEGTGEFVSSSGMIYKAISKTPRRRFECEYVGLSAERVEAFYDDIVSKRDTTPIFLYTQSQHQVLDDLRLFHCKLETVEKETVYTDYINLKLSFLEVLG